MSRAGGVLRQERQAPVSGDFPGKDLLRGGERFPVGDLLRVGACFPVGELLRAGACFPVGDFLPAGGRLPVNYGLLRWEYSPENEKLQAQARRLAGKRFPTSGSFPAASLILQQAGPPAQEILFLGPRGRIMCAGSIFKSFSEAAQKTVSLLPGRRIRKPSISESGRCSGKWDSDTGSRTDMDRLKQVRDATVRRPYSCR